MESKRKFYLEAPVRVRWKGQRGTILSQIVPRCRSIEAAFGLLVTLYYLFAIFNTPISVFYSIFPYICNEYKPITQ